MHTERVKVTNGEELTEQMKLKLPVKRKLINDEIDGGETFICLLIKIRMIMLSNFPNLINSTFTIVLGGANKLF